MSMSEAARLRRRAHSLRTLAATIESLPLMRLDALAGPDTWQGPVPTRRVEELRRYQHRLHRDAEDLRRRAWWLDQEADALERTAAIAGIA